MSEEIQQCAYLTGNHAEADEWTATMLEHARTSLAKAEILSTRTRQYATLGRMHESIQAAIAGLSLLGIELIESPSPDDIKHEIAQVGIHLQGRSIPELIDAPEITDKEVLTAIRLLIARHVLQHNQANPDRQALLVAYDNLNPKYSKDVL